MWYIENSENQKIPLQVFDVESDGFLDVATVIHCLSIKDATGTKTYTSKEDICNYISSADMLAGHNIIMYDLPLLKKLYGVEPKEDCIIFDTLGISWHLEPLTRIHGLEHYGDVLETPKVVIQDWQNLSLEEYIKRCERDVLINYKVLSEQYEYLVEIYGFFPMHTLEYVNFKMFCLKEQERVGVRFDKKYCEQSFKAATKEYDDKYSELQSVMPKKYANTLKAKPKNPYKKDGTLSVNGNKWFKLLKEHNLDYTTEEVKEMPNPSSHTQLKKWLTDLNWKPQTFKISKATGKSLPQVSLPFGKGLCPSIKDLYDVEPNLSALEGFYMIKHRVGLFKSFLKNEKNGRLYTGSQGFTNTMRMAHKAPAANLPKPSVPWGKEIRGTFIADEGCELLGCDIKGLESATAHHFIYYFDPAYVEEMRTPGFDAHLDLGLLAKLIDKKEEEYYKWYKEQKTTTAEQDKLFKAIDKKRGTSKTVNFACQYNAFPPKIQETAKITLKEAEELWKIYWERNWALKAIANNLTVKKVRNQWWQLNPANNMWYFLKARKDQFSTLNQGFGAYVFDTFLMHAQKYLPYPVVFQAHDELLTNVPLSKREEIKRVLKKAMDETNAKLNLNVTIEFDAQFGPNYSNVH